MEKIYIVKVIMVSYDKTHSYEEEIFEYEYEPDEGEDMQQACAEALKISYYGCSDED